MRLVLKQSYPSIHGYPVIEKVDTEVFTRNFPFRDCLAVDCADICCSGGATMDISSFDKLLAYREHFPWIDWTGYDFREDFYSPGGRGCYTRFPDQRCMFQTPGGRGCAIHAYSLQNGIDYRTIKFFTCCLFPCEVNKVGPDENVLTAGYELRYQSRFNLPCGQQPGGESIYRVCRENLQYYYGAELIGELDQLQTTCCAAECTLET